MSGAALFAGADLVGVLVVELGGSPPDHLRAVTLAALAADPAFVRLVGDGRGLVLAPVSTPLLGLPILHAP